MLIVAEFAASGKLLGGPSGELEGGESSRTGMDLYRQMV
jgi:hypothetical protein